MTGKLTTSSGTSSKSVAEKFGFSFVASSPNDVIDDDQAGTIFVATRHDAHADYVQKALNARKNVFVEKPLCLSANGPKEYVEIYTAGVTARLMDFKEIEILGGEKPIRRKLMSQDKGQKAMVGAFLSAIKGEHECPIPLHDTLATTVTTLGVLESLRSGNAVSLAAPIFTD